MKEYEMVKIGNYIADILSASKDELEKLSYIKEEIKALLKDFPIYE
jgi:glycine/serine hydroxymethyltransferase